MDEQSQVRGCYHITFNYTNGSMDEQSQVRGYYHITFNYTNEETVSVLEKTQTNKTFRT